MWPSWNDKWDSFMLFKTIMIQSEWLGFLRYDSGHVEMMVFRWITMHVNVQDNTELHARVFLQISSTPNHIRRMQRPVHGSQTNAEESHVRHSQKLEISSLAFLTLLLLVLTNQGWFDLEPRVRSKRRESDLSCLIWRASCATTHFPDCVRLIRSLL